MSNQNNTPIPWETIRVWAVSIIVPLLGLFFTGVIFAIRVDDKLTSIGARQDKVENSVDQIKVKVDTIERRQAIYQATHR